MNWEKLRYYVLGAVVILLISVIARPMIGSHKRQQSFNPDGTISGGLNDAIDMSLDESFVRSQKDLSLDLNKNPNNFESCFGNIGLAFKNYTESDTTGWNAVLIDGDIQYEGKNEYNINHGPSNIKEGLMDSDFIIINASKPYDFSSEAFIVDGCIIQLIFQEDRSKVYTVWYESRKYRDYRNEVQTIWKMPYTEKTVDMINTEIDNYLSNENIENFPF